MKESKALIIFSMIEKIKFLFAHKNFIRYFKNTSWLFAEKVLRMLSGLFVGIWVARYLGPEKLGIMSYAQSFVALFAIVASLGLDDLVVRELVKNESRAKTLLGTSFILKLIGAISLIIFIGIALHFTSNDYNTKVFIFIIASTYLFQSFNVLDYYFQSKVMSKYTVYAKVISLLISSAVKIILILINANLEAFIWVILFDSIVSALGYLYYFFKHTDFKLKKMIFSRSVAIFLLKNSWPLILSGALITIYMRIDQIMIKHFLGNNYVGQYSAAIRISEIWYFIPVVFGSSFFPAFINAKKHNDELYLNRIQRFYDLIVLIALALAIPVTFFSDTIVELLYGSQYNQAGSVLTIHIWAGVFLFLGVASGKWILIENLQKIAFWRAFLGMIINIFLNIILIPKYGIRGAALATLLSQMGAAYFFDLIIHKTRKMFFMKTKAIFLINYFKSTILFFKS